MENLKKAMIIRGGNVIGAVGNKNFSTLHIGCVIPFAGNTDNMPRGYLACDGASYPTAEYPDLYAVIGNTYGGDSTNFNVPDYRETVLVGVGENTTDTIADHDIYELGEFKDDQLQGHKHGITQEGGSASSNVSPNSPALFGGTTGSLNTAVMKDAYSDGTNGEPRVGTTTHGKQKGVTYIIKAFHTNEGTDSKNEVSDPIIEYVESEIDALVSDEVSDSTVWSSKKTSDEIDALISDTNLTSTTSTLSASKIMSTVRDSAVGLGMTKNGIHTIQEFFTFLIDKYGKKGCMDVQWSDANGAYVKHENTIIGINGGMLIWDGTDVTPDSTGAYQTMTALYIPHRRNLYSESDNYNGVYKIYCVVAATAGVVSHQGIEIIGNIDDSSTGNTTSTWSSSKIASELKTSSNTDVISTPNLVDTAYFDYSGNRNVSNYMVKNGICYFTIFLVEKTHTTSFVTIMEGLPKALMTTYFSFAPYYSASGDNTSLQVNISPNGTIAVSMGAKDNTYMLTGSYPIA